MAETTSGRLISAEAAAALGTHGSGSGGGGGGGDEQLVPEDLGRGAAHALLEEIDRGGVVDSAHQARCFSAQEECCRAGSGQAIRRRRCCPAATAGQSGLGLGRLSSCSHNRLLP